MRSIEQQTKEAVWIVVGIGMVCVIASLFSGCGSKERIFVDPNITPYFDRFTQMVGVSAEGISATFADLISPTIGMCKTNADDVRDIKIDKTYWEKANDDEREELVFHELSHCALNLDHIIALNEYGCPMSIMYPYVFGNSLCYKKNKPYYFSELASHK